MNDTNVALLVFASLFGATLLGMRISAMLPEHHLSSETKESVRLGMGTVATMTALILGLLVASTKGAYDVERNEVTQLAAKLVYLDRVLADYGPEADHSRDVLRGAVDSALARIWPETADGSEEDPSDIWTATLPNSIHDLAPKDEEQRASKAQAERVVSEIAQVRWLLFEQTETSISTPLLVLVVSWLTVIFLSVGLFAPRNITAVIAHLMAAFSISGAIYLILELDKPFSGLIKISSEPMMNALNHLVR
ncbi:MAG TPA: hypothetical protein PLF26_01775 [Blastocatellia bacterium]|nr:hypothetical protein [Blastocatellia bacterium]